MNRRPSADSTLNAPYRLLAALVCLVGTALFVTVATLLYWPTPEFAFFSENSPVSWLSSAQLWAIAVLSLRLGIECSLPRWTATWLVASTTALAFDEQFMLHEQWKFGCSSWLDACHKQWVTELPMILVGVVGVATVAHLHHVIPHRPARLLLWSAYSVGALALAVDLLEWPRMFIRFEEGLEVLAEALFIGALAGLPNRQEHSV